MRKQVFSSHRVIMFDIPPGPFPGKGVTLVRGLRPLRRFA